MTTKTRYYETSQDAYRELALEIAHNPEWAEGHRGTYNYRIYTHDVLVEIGEPTPDLNIALCGFKMQRWAKFMTDYFDQPTFRAFTEFITKRKRNDAQGYFYTCPRKARHSLGNCLIGFGIKTGKNPRVMMVSRSCYLQPTGILDLQFASLLCQWVDTLAGKDTKPCTLSWHIGHLQQNCWRILPYLMNNNLDPLTFIQDELDNYQTWTIEGNLINNILIPNPHQVQFHQRITQAVEWAANNEDPNIRYMFYSRYIKKYNAIIARKAAGIPLDIFIPQIPQAYLPGGVDETLQFDDDDDEEDDDQ